jgi:hypothetical protein
VRSFISPSSSLLSSSLTHSSAPIGVRCSPFPSPINSNRDSNPYLAQTNIITGFGLGKTILTEDLKMNIFPFTSSNFADFVTDRELKRFSVLQLKLHEVIHEKDILRLEANKGIADVIPALNDLSQVKAAVYPFCPTVLEWIRSQEFMTLWEMWKYITVALKVHFNIELLRQLIASDAISSGPFAELELYCLYLPSEDELYASSDGLRVKQVVSQRTNTKDYYQSPPLCHCHNLNAPSDGDADDHEDYDSFDLYAQLSSHGYSQSRSQGENTNSMSSFSSLPQPILTCCELETCLVPHLIVYKLKKQIWPQKNSESHTSSTKQTRRKETNSDVTFDVVASLRDLWDEEDG